MNRLHCTMAAVNVVIVALSSVATAQADPAPPVATPDPFPDIRYYDQLDASNFALPGGVWFTAPTGDSCGLGSGQFRPCR